MLNDDATNTRGHGFRDGKEDGHPLTCISDVDADKLMMKWSTSTSQPCGSNWSNNHQQVGGNRPLRQNLRIKPRGGSRNRIRTKCAENKHPTGVTATP
jgi:hypothetical protein